MIHTLFFFVFCIAKGDSCGHLDSSLDQICANSSLLEFIHPRLGIYLKAWEGTQWCIFLSWLPVRVSQK